jgi:hypothetical protein
LEFLLQAKSDISAKNVSGSDFLSFLTQVDGLAKDETGRREKGKQQKTKIKRKGEGGGAGERESVVWKGRLWVQGFSGFMPWICQTASSEGVRRHLGL